MSKNWLKSSLILFGTAIVLFLLRVRWLKVGDAQSAKTALSLVWVFIFIGLLSLLTTLVIFLSDLNKGLKELKKEKEPN